MALINNDNIDIFGNEAGYLVIDWILIDKNKKTVDLILSIYKDKDARLNKMQPVGTQRINCADILEYEAFFTGVIDIYKQAYLYVAQLKNIDLNLQFVNWSSDE